MLQKIETERKTKVNISFELTKFTKHGLLMKKQ